MNKLNTLRKKIDNIDKKILDLIAQRLGVVQEIGREKRRIGIEIIDKEREEAIFNDLIKSGQEKKVSPEIIESVWKILIKASYVLEER